MTTQVQRGDCEVILNLDADRTRAARLFVSLGPEDLRTLQREIEARSIQSTLRRWGHPVFKIRDPDGNEVLFPLDVT